MQKEILNSTISENGQKIEDSLDLEKITEKYTLAVDSFSDDVDLVCLSHLRWDFVFQRPQHLLTRCSSNHRVFFVEEPKYHSSTEKVEYLEVSKRGEKLFVVVPHLNEGLRRSDVNASLQRLLPTLLKNHSIERYVLWYYTPMAMEFSSGLTPLATIYDCMDELSAFKGAPEEMRVLEAELFQDSDLVFTGGQSLYEAKRDKHKSVHLFPSSIDFSHFSRAREITEEPEDQKDIPHPRMGYFGVIDERMDLELLAGIAEMRPDWQLVIIGPVVKIDPSILPKHSNIHYLGGKDYKQLPEYLAGWDIALLPFALNESTRFISPTKTPEYLAAGKPVVSTPIRDVIRPYGELDLVKIAASAEDFVAEIEQLLTNNQGENTDWVRRVDEFLQQNSWDSTWSQMSNLIGSVISDNLVSGQETVNRSVETAKVSFA
jgi:glycosyltransferase involved in cell wall biosynthesis